MADLLPLPEGLALDPATWEHTPLGVQHVVVQLLASLPQQTARIQALAARLADLEARLQQRAHHADRPPAADPPDEHRPARAGPHGKPGATPGHPGHQQALVAPTEGIAGKPSACAWGPTAALDTSPYSTPQVLALPKIQMLGRHVVWYEASCPQGGRITKAPVPPEAHSGDGPRWTARMGALSGRQRDSGSAGQEFCPSVLGGPRSRGAMQRAVDRVAAAITPHDEARAAKACGAPVNELDETAWYQHGGLAWWGVMVNPPVAFVKVQASRRTAAFEALVERGAGSLVRDGAGGYGQWGHGQQTWRAHLLRRARGLAERQDPELARVGRRVMTAWQRLAHWATAPPTSGEVQTWDARMVHLLEHHRERQEAGGTCARTLARELGALGTVGVAAGVDPTNKRAERARRFAVLWRTLMPGTDNATGDRWVERLLSVRETCRLRHRPTFPVLVEAVTC